MIKAKTWRGAITRYAHHKYDGMTLSIGWEEGSLYALTRTPINIVDKLRGLGWLLEIHKRLPPDCAVHGELYVPGRKASQVSNALAENPDRLRFVGFAVEGPCYTAEMPLHDVNHTLARWGVEAAPFLVQESLKYEGLGGCGWFTSPDALLDIALPRHVEGFMLKDGNMLQWFKLKPVHTIDVIVSGYKDASFGKFFGMVGSITVKTIEGIEVAHVSGMDDETRLDVTEEPDKYLGRVCEVSYQYVGDKGRLRHPNFVRWRDDKTAAECTLAQDEELVSYWE